VTEKETWTIRSIWFWGLRLPITQIWNIAHAKAWASLSFRWVMLKVSKFQNHRI